MKIEKNSLVYLKYKLTDDSGKVLDTTEGKDPLIYIHGKGLLIPGLEKELEGKQSGDVINVRINPEDAYGERREELVQVVPRDQFEPGQKIEEGMQFEADTDQGVIPVTIVKVDDDEVTIDSNHPLAGVHLNFEVEVESVQHLTDEEIEKLYSSGGGCGQDHDGSCGDGDDEGGCGCH